MVDSIHNDLRYDAPENGGGSRGRLLRALEECKGGIFRLAQQFGFRPEDAEDELQSLGLKLSRYPDDFPIHTSAWGLVLQIARNDFRRAAGQVKRKAATPLDNCPEPECAPSRQAIDRQELDMLLDRIGASDSDREMFIRRADGNTWPEIASILGLPEGTLKSRAFRLAKRARDIHPEYRAGDI